MKIKTLKAIIDYGAENRLCASTRESISHVTHVASLDPGQASYLDTRTVSRVIFRNLKLGV